MVKRESHEINEQSFSPWFRENLRAVAQQLKIEVPAAIALCSLPPIGEDPASVNPFQRELYRRIEEYSAFIKEIAREQSVARTAEIRNEAVW